MSTVVVTDLTLSSDFVRIVCVLTRLQTVFRFYLVLSARGVCLRIFLRVIIFFVITRSLVNIISCNCLCPVLFLCSCCCCLQDSLTSGFSPDEPERSRACKGVKSGKNSDSAIGGDSGSEYSQGGAGTHLLVLRVC